MARRGSCQACDASLCTQTYASEAFQMPCDKALVQDPFDGAADIRDVNEETVMSVGCVNFIVHDGRISIHPDTFGQFTLLLHGEQDITLYTKNQDRHIP